MLLVIVFFPCLMLGLMVGGYSAWDCHRFKVSWLIEMITRNCVSQKPNGWSTNDLVSHFSYMKEMNSKSTKGLVWFVGGRGRKLVNGKVKKMPHVWLEIPKQRDGKEASHGNKFPIFYEKEKYMWDMEKNFPRDGNCNNFFQNTLRPSWSS